MYATHFIYIQATKLVEEDEDEDEEDVEEEDDDGLEALDLDA